MKRDMDLIRTLLLKLEDYPLKAGNIVTIPFDHDVLKVIGYNSDQIHYNLSQIYQSGFVDNGKNNQKSIGVSGITFRGLTPSGHDFLDSVRDPDIWEKTKEGTQKVGGFTLDILASCAKGLITKQIEEYTGVKINI
jgi:hypothetical protein